MVRVKTRLSFVWKDDNYVKCYLGSANRFGNGCAMDSETKKLNLAVHCPWSPGLRLIDDIEMTYV